MDRPVSSWISERRRTLLKGVGITAGGALAAASETRTADAAESFVLLQGDRCVPLTPLSGSKPVEELYDYTYPQKKWDGPPGSDGYSYSSEGTTDLQRDRTSILFLYDGPNGLSLVVVHGRHQGERDAGGLVTFTIRGLPAEGRWVVRDDYYLTEEGEQAASNIDRWNVDGEVHTVDWGYRPGLTDGGAFRGLQSDLDVRIEPAFNAAARFAGEYDWGPVEGWEVLSGDLASPDRYSLRLDREIRITRGPCPSDEETARREEEHKHRTKHEKHEEKRKKHEKHRKREQKHRKKQRKHRKKQKKHEKKKKKHEKHRKGRGD